MENDAAPTEADGFLSPEEEAELVERAQAGDPWAVNDLLDAHEPVVRAAVNSLTRYGEGERKPQLQDVARQALADAWQGFDPERGRFGAYAKTAVRHRVQDALQRLRERDENDTDAFLDDATGPDKPGETVHDVTADPETDPHSAGPKAPDAFLNRPEATERREQLGAQARLILLILEQNPLLLSPRQSAVVKAILRGHTPELIADALDTRPDSIRRSRNQAVEKIREHLEKMADAGGYRDPFKDVEAEEAPDRQYADPFQQTT